MKVNKQRKLEERRKVLPELLKKDRGVASWDYFREGQSFQLAG